MKLRYFWQCCDLLITKAELHHMTLLMHAVVFIPGITNAKMRYYFSKAYSSAPNKCGVRAGWKILQNELSEGLEINGGYIFVYFDSNRLN